MYPPLIGTWLSGIPGMIKLDMDHFLPGNKFKMCIPLLYISLKYDMHILLLVRDIKCSYIQELLMFLDNVRMISDSDDGIYEMHCLWWRQYECW